MPRKRERPAPHTCLIALKPPPLHPYPIPVPEEALTYHPRSADRPPNARGTPSYHRHRRRIASSVCFLARRSAVLLPGAPPARPPHQSSQSHSHPEHVHTRVSKRLPRRHFRPQNTGVGDNGDPEPPTPLLLIKWTRWTNQGTPLPIFKSSGTAPRLFRDPVYGQTQV